jgi:hypothetical protein
MGTLFRLASHSLNPQTKQRENSSTIKPARDRRRKWQAMTNVESPPLDCGLFSSLGRLFDRGP